MNKNFDPYKKTILFVFSLISVALMATVFAFFLVSDILEYHVFLSLLPQR